MPTYTGVAGPTTFVFGTSSTDFSGISLTGFSPRTVSAKDTEPEVFATAINGEGNVEAIGISTSSNRKISITVTGYITSAFDSTTIGNTFTYGGRKFFVKRVSEPRPKGEFVEISVEAESHPLITTDPV